MEKLLAFDPSSNKTGYAFGLYEGQVRVEETGTIKLKNTDSPLAYLYGSVLQLLDRLNPDRVLLETPFYSINAQTLIKLGEVRGVILLACQTKGVEVEEFTPAEVKISIAGYGRASKQEVLDMVNNIYQIDTKDYDIADAVAILHAYTMRLRV